MKAISKIEDLIHNETKGLPEPLLNEILDFILFLKHKKLASPSKKNIRYGLDEMKTTEINHLEEEFKDYKNRFPREE